MCALCVQWFFFAVCCLHIFSFWCTTVTEWIHVSFYWNICSPHFFFCLLKELKFPSTFFYMSHFYCNYLVRGAFFSFLSFFFFLSQRIHHFYYATVRTSKRIATQWNVSFTMCIVLYIGWLKYYKKILSWKLMTTTTNTSAAAAAHGIRLCWIHFSCA